MSKTDQENSSNEDSDPELNENCESEIVSRGYERLREDVETVIIIHNSSDCDENLENANQINSNNKIVLNLPSEKYKKNLLGDNVNAQASLSKSKSANFENSNLLRSPSMVKGLTSSANQLDLNVKNGISDKSNRIIHRNSVIYDVPRQNVAPVKSENENFKNSQKNLENGLDVPLSMTTPSHQLFKINISKPLTTKSITTTQTNQNSQNIGIYRFLEEKYKCKICQNPYLNPKILQCLHTFCKQCLMDIEIEKNSNNQNVIKNVEESENGDWNSGIKIDRAYSYSGSSGSHDCSTSENIESKGRTGVRRSIFSIRPLISKDGSSTHKDSSRDRTSSTISITNRMKIINCPICNHSTEYPAGSINFLTSNYILARQTDEALVKIGADTTNNCNLCCSDISATFFCITCNLNLCAFCNEAHTRQRITSHHEIKSFGEIRKISNAGKYDDTILTSKKKINCPIHKIHELKLFCTICKQVACSDCTILIHRGHKCETIAKASKIYIKQLKYSLEKVRPLSDYANHTISNLSEMTKKINKKCDKVQGQVEQFLNDYFIAMELHQKTLINQIARARESKIELIKEQQIELEKKSLNARSAIQFTKELLWSGNDTEILTCVGILSKRFDEFQTSNKNLNMNITDSLQFLPEIQAPNQNPNIKIPLFGIITTQTAVAKFCTLETKDLWNFRVHKKSELIVVSKDNSERPLCHGGLNLIVELRYQDASARIVKTQISDKRDGTYTITFTADAPGSLKLSIFIKGRHIKGSPYLLRARNLRQHTGIYHCCAFCSSDGAKNVTCGCGGLMPGYAGCGHGHEGHPGRRHWSCCANILQNSECSKANAIAFPS